MTRRRAQGMAVLYILAFIGAGAIFLFVSCLVMVSQIH